ncbi:MAG TPA: beta-ketoacyl synthase chain length factor [Xanthomonadaceae bacterium]|nr:beta-ketoacyl synthase chain length factor [Xanthomonadaceae bacterium]
MTTLSAAIAGIGFWTDGLPSWDEARAFARSGVLPERAPARPTPDLLAPNERRRAPETVAVALDVAQAACAGAGLDPATLSSVFASTHGDLAITDYMCETLARAPAEISPTRFHNSVHNAAAGYWTIGTGCVKPATALSAYRATFAQGLLEALVQLAAGNEAVLLVAYDTPARGPLGTQARSTGLLGGALVLARDGAGARISATLETGEAPPGDGPLARHARENAMAPMLPLFDALAAGAANACLDAGSGRVLRVEITHG